ncbi:kinase-like domain-containing protein, partial [Mycena leptocephala]
GSERWIFMEYVPGCSLFEILERMEMSEVDCKAVIRQVLKGLVHLHDLDIIHRDQGANILISVNGVVKLSDFGISKLMADVSATGATRTGTDGFVSPEILRGCGYSIKSDIWSLDCVVLEIFVGDWPCGGYTSLYPEVIDYHYFSITI